MARPHLVFLVLVGLTAGCGDNSGVADSVDGVSDLPTLVSIIEDLSYKSWAAEPSIHETRAPHGARVRVFFNPIVEASLRSGATVHPVGSMTLKELYNADDTLRGYAIAVKDREGDEANNWVWYESFGDYSNPEFHRRGHPTCANCHDQGRDYVTSFLPAQ